MIEIGTALHSSAIEGVGVFNLQSLEKDAVVASFHPLIDLCIEIENVMNEHQTAKDFMWRYAAFQRGMLFLSIDNTRFLNHSDTPNLSYIYQSEQDWSYAARGPIPQGSELTIDYRQIDDREPNDTYDTYRLRWLGLFS